MSRYIDADALIDSIIEKWGMNPKYFDDHLDALKDVQALEWINSASTIDAVSVVRCKECKYKSVCSHSVQHTTHKPTSVTIAYKSVEWCSYGEREGE